MQYEAFRYICLGRLLLKCFALYFQMERGKAKFIILIFSQKHAWVIENNHLQKKAKDLDKLSDGI